MRILFVTHYYPYPPNDGGRIGYFNPLKYLSRKNEMFLASLLGPGDHEYAGRMRQFCADELTYVHGGSNYWRLIRGMIGSRPGAAAKYYDPAFGSKLRAFAQRCKPDVIELQHLNTAAYLPWVSDIAPVILREHNVEYKVWERHAEHAKGPERLYVGMVAPRVRKYEADAARQFARCITVSQADERYLLDVAPEAEVLTIPSGVDAEYFTPGDSAEDPFSMVITGSFSWQPKQHNLRILMSRIFPRIRQRIPQATLTVVGKGVPEHLMRLGCELGVTITGPVEDVRPYVHRAGLFLNYLESGGGIALKVLEAMAMKKAVLSNELGVEGISLNRGEHVEVADLDTFADAAVALLESPERRSALGSRAYDWALRNYAWSSLADRFQEVYEQVCSERREASTAGGLVRV